MLTILTPRIFKRLKDFFPKSRVYTDIKLKFLNRLYFLNLVSTSPILSQCLGCGSPVLKIVVNKFGTNLHNSITVLIKVSNWARFWLPRNSLLLIVTATRWCKTFYKYMILEKIKNKVFQELIKRLTRTLFKHYMILRLAITERYSNQFTSRIERTVL